MRIRIDEEQCQGHGVCNMTSPEMFLLREEDGHAYVLSEEVAPKDEQAARDGADACPERAVVIEE